MVPETLIWIVILLLLFIALLLVMLIRMVRRLVGILSDSKAVQPSVPLESTPGVPDEDLAVITAIVYKMLPSVKIGAMQVNPITK